MSSPERVRLFVALELPHSVVRTLVGWCEPLIQREPALRAVASTSLHVTLCFLGWRGADEIEHISNAFRAAVKAHPGAALAIKRPLWLPARRPRVLTVELDDHGGTLALVQADLSAALEAGGWYEPEKRPFLAHVTVARVVRAGRVQHTDIPSPPPQRFRGTTVTLFRSRLSRAGAQYERLDSVQLE